MEFKSMVLDGSSFYFNCSKTSS